MQFCPETTSHWTLACWENLGPCHYLWSRSTSSVIWVHFSNISKSLDQDIALAVNVDHSRWVFLCFVVSISAGWFNLSVGYRDGKISQTLLGSLVRLKSVLQWMQPSMKEYEAWSVWLLAWFVLLSRRKLYSLGCTSETERGLFPHAEHGSVSIECPKMEMIYSFSLLL